MINNSPCGNVLLVSSDITLIDFLCLNLRSEGFSVSVIPETGDIKNEDLKRIQLIIFDSNAKLDIVNLIKDIKLNANTRQCGIVFCSEFEDDRSLIEALDAGADDCIRRPFSLREMLARIRAIMRRRVPVKIDEQTDIIQFKNLRIDTVRRMSHIGDEPIPLSNTELSILELLLRQRNTFVSRKEIFEKVWNSAGSNERVVDTNISRLRHKLEEVGITITNRTGMGYMIAD